MKRPKNYAERLFLKRWNVSAVARLECRNNKIKKKKERLRPFRLRSKCELQDNETIVFLLQPCGISSDDPAASGTQSSTWIAKLGRKNSVKVAGGVSTRRPDGTARRHGNGRLASAPSAVAMATAPGLIIIRRQQLLKHLPPKAPPSVFPPH